MLHATSQNVVEKLALRTLLDVTVSIRAVNKHVAAVGMSKLSGEARGANWDLLRLRDVVAIVVALFINCDLKLMNLGELENKLHCTWRTLVRHRTREQHSGK